MFRCLAFSRSDTPALIALQTSLKWINILISGSSRGIISRVHIVCDYCSVTPDADPGLCTAPCVWGGCRPASSLQIPLFHFMRLMFRLMQLLFLWVCQTVATCGFFPHNSHLFSKSFWVLKSFLSSLRKPSKCWERFLWNLQVSSCTFHIYRCPFLDLSLPVCCSLRHQNALQFIALLHCLLEPEL